MKKKKVSIIKLDDTDNVEIQKPTFLGGLTKKVKSSKTPKKEKPLKKAKKLNEKLIQKKEWTLVTPETHWKCIRCGWCCRQNWRVNVTWKEYDRLKDILNIDQVVMDKKSGMSHPLFEIKDACVCLNTKKNLCTIHSKWPYACATFPFGLDLEGRLVYSKWCKGIGEGSKVDPGKMLKKIMKERKKAGMS